MIKLAPLIQLFFSDRLQQQLQASPNTIAAYRDTFKIFFKYLKNQLGKEPSALNLEDIDAQCIGQFLRYLEEERGNTGRSRNARLAAIHSFFNYVCYREPQYSGQVQRILNIPQKRFEKREVSYLNRNESEALLAMPIQTTWIGKRDYTLLVLALQTGLRVSELIELKIEQIKFDDGAYIRCWGKGRKERCTPLTKETQKVLKAWLKTRKGSPSEVIFQSLRGTKLSRDAIEKLVRKYSIAAQKKCVSLKEKNVTPHVLRHTTAVNLLQAGVDSVVIALYLGHESIYVASAIMLPSNILPVSIPTNQNFHQRGNRCLMMNICHH